jgi:enoyl-CoA hydratase
MRHAHLPDLLYTTYVLVRSSIDGNGVASVELDAATRANALDKQMSDELASEVDQVVADGARVIVLSARGPVFCAGGSLPGLLAPQHPLSALYAGVEALTGCPVPTIALVDGPAVGAGVTLALACDVIICTPRARFDPRFLDLAIHPGGGHLWRLAGRIGVQGAAALVLLGDELDGNDAATTGLAWRCLPREQAKGLVDRLAERVAKRSPELVRCTKRALRETASLPNAVEAAAVELAAQEWSVAQPDHRRAVEALAARLGLPVQD